MGRSIQFVGMIVLIVLLGVGAIWFFTRSRQATQRAPYALADVKLGTLHLVDPNQNPSQAPFTETYSFAADAGIAMRVVTASDVRQPITFSVRLLTDSQQVHPLTPDSVTFLPGKDTFCCWLVQESGRYTLQLVRPEGTFTSLPFTIRPVAGGRGLQ